MNKVSLRIGMGALVLAAAVLSLVVAFGMSQKSASGVGLPTGDTFKVDAISGGAIDTSVTLPVGGVVTFDTNVTAAPDAYAAYQSNVFFNNAVLGSPTGPTETNLGGATLCGGGTIGASNLYDGCARQSGTSTATGNAFTWTLTCIAPGTSPLHLLTDAEVGDATGTNFAIGAGTADATTQDATVNCVLPVTKTDNLPNTPGNNVAIAGSQVTYTITIFNPTGAPGSSIPAQTVSDTIPAPTTFVSAVSTGGGVCGGVLPGASGVLGCITNLVNPSTTITVVVDVPLSAAGTTGICDSAQVQGGLSQVATDCIDVAPSNVTIAKVADAATYKAGDPISWTITINSTGPSPATGVSVSDTATDGFDITGSSVSSGACVAGATTLTTASFTGGTMNSGASCVLKVTGTVHTPNPTDLSCNNSASVSWTNAGTAATAASTSCLSKDAQMVKDTDGNLDEDNELANLWLCKTPAMTLCTTTNGQGFLDITENVLNISGDPQGLGAFEFQLKYDNHIFDISITATNYLYSTGRIPNAPGGVGGCQATIITENDIRFGCVSKDDPANNSSNCLGPDNVTVIVGIQCGPTANGVLATIHVTPKIDLFKRMTPGNNNGAVRSLLDEGCELADIWGHPLSAAPDPSGIDPLGREIPLGGINPGGQLAEANCKDITITVRILEGDMDADCDVDVTDDQIEASHYGAFFGTLLYDPWYDLEPELKDFDVDIKDLQKVFGRNGSTCANPIPNQDPVVQPGDP